MDIKVRLFDLIVITVFLVVIMAIGLWSAYRNRGAGTDNFFTGNRSLPGWLVGLSMLGSIVSSATFLALPAAAYVLDWRQLSVNIVMPLVAVVAVVIFIPFFRRSGLISTFEYLGDRFGVPARIYGTVSFVIMQLIRTAQILFLVSLPMQFLTGMPIQWVIVSAGLFVAFYTIAGGLESVVWANAVQAIIMIGGGMLCLAMIVLELPGGLMQVVKDGAAAGKFSLGSFEWNVGERTFWTVMILGVVNWFYIYSGEQTMVQRYVSAKSTKEARKATILFAMVSLPMWTMFFFIGTALFVYYQVFTDSTAASLQADQVLPYFVLTKIPIGLAGVVISGVLAAALSSLDSGVNSIATVVVVDIVKPHLAPNRDDRFYVRMARIITGGAIVLMGVGAMIFTVVERESMNDISLIMTSVFGGSMAGLYLLGFFTTRVDGRAVNIALVVAITFNAYLGIGLTGLLPESWIMGVHSYWVGVLVNLVFVSVAYGVGWFRPHAPNTLHGLTVWTSKGRTGIDL